MEEIMQIRNSSQELFTEVINTLPIYPISFEITMFAYGISVPKSPRELEQYLSQCENANVIPFLRAETNMYREYPGLSTGLIVPDIDIFKEHTSRLKNLAVSSAIKGGKFNLIEIVSKTGPAYLSRNHREDCKGLFTIFKESLFEPLRKEEYEVQQGRLVLTENGGILFFNRGDDCSKGLELRYYQQMYKENKIKLEGWFNGLKNKYDIDS